MQGWYNSERRKDIGISSELPGATTTHNNNTTIDYYVEEAQADGRAIVTNTSLTFSHRQGGMKIPTEAPSARGFAEGFFTLSITSSTCACFRADGSVSREVKWAQSRYFSQVLNRSEATGPNQSINTTGYVLEQACELARKLTDAEVCTSPATTSYAMKLAELFHYVSGGCLNVTLHSCMFFGMQ